MELTENIFQWLLGIFLIASSLGVILVHQPIQASLCFLLTLLFLAAFYLQLSAPFLAVMQVIVYAGAILVIFVFVIVLFQDAHAQIDHFKKQSSWLLITLAGFSFVIAMSFLGIYYFDSNSQMKILPEMQGTAESLGRKLYIDYFFPFEAVILLFLIAVIGSLYLAKKEV